MNALPRVHVVTNDQILASNEFIALATPFMNEPIALHLRGRAVSGITLQTLARSLQACGDQASVVINDRVDVAVATGVHHVHLPETGLPPHRVKKEFGNGLTVGASTHSPMSATRALEGGADYVFLGPIWQTRSHPDRAPIGVEAISKVKQGRVIAIGGVTVERIAACREAGAYGVAAISTIWDAADPAAIVHAICGIFHQRSN